MKNSLSKLFTRLVAVALLGLPVLASAERPGGGFPGPRPFPPGGGGFGQGCFTQVEQSAGRLRHAVSHLGLIASRIEPYGQTTMATERSTRAIGAVQYQISRTCDRNRLLHLRDQARDSLDSVRQAFRTSQILSSDPRAFAAFRNMVTHWESFRDLVSDVASGGGGGQIGCQRHIMLALSDLGQRVQGLAQTAAYFENRGQTEFTAGIAAREIQQLLQQLNHVCGQGQLVHARNSIRARLDAVRNAFRLSPVLSREPQAFNAFRSMVDAWERFRDLVSDVELH